MPYQTPQGRATRAQNLPEKRKPPPMVQQIFSLGFGRGWRAPTVPGIIIWISLYYLIPVPRLNPVYDSVGD